MKLQRGIDFEKGCRKGLNDEGTRGEANHGCDSDILAPGRKNVKKLRAGNKEGLIDDRTA